MFLLSYNKDTSAGAVTGHLIVCLPAQVLISALPLSGALPLALCILGFLSPSCTFSPSLSVLEILICSCFTRFACYKRTAQAPVRCTTRELLCSPGPRSLLLSCSIHRVLPISFTFPSLSLPVLSPQLSPFPIAVQVTNTGQGRQCCISAQMQCSDLRGAVSALRWVKPPRNAQCN